MAGKSKGFKELLMQKKASEDKQKIMQKMKREIESNNNTEVIVEPEGYEKMSDVIIKFLQPYIIKLRNPEEYRKLVVIGILAWNASLMTQKERKEMINEIVSQSIAYGETEAQTAMIEIVNELIQRKEKHFSHIKRYITDYKLTKTGKEFNLSIVSSLIDDKDEKE